MNTRIFSLLVLWLTSVSLAVAQKKVTVLEVPAIHQYARIDTNGVPVLPSGRFVTPASKMVRITHAPFGLAVSPDSKRAITLHNGVLTLVDLASMETVRVPQYGTKEKDLPFKSGSFLGVAFAPDSKTIFFSGGDNGAVFIFDTQRLQLVDSLSINGKINGKSYEDSFTSDLLFDSLKNELLVLDRGNFRLVRINLATKSNSASINVGRQPFGLALSPNHKMAFVANVGMYSYPLIKGATPVNVES